MGRAGPFAPPLVLAASQGSDEPPHERGEKPTGRALAVVESGDRAEKREHGLALAHVDADLLPQAPLVRRPALS
jgi:hypothetical protein